MQGYTRYSVCGLCMVLFLFTQYGTFADSSCDSMTEMPTESLKHVIIGRCVQYQTLVNPAPFCTKMKNCTHLWELFLSGFAYRSPCNTSNESSQPFIDAAYHDTPRDKLIFWSGVYDFVTRYSNGGRKRTSISDTLTGYMVDGLTFCGSTTSVDGNEANLTACIRCPQSAYSAFWSPASISYALYTKGSIEIMLNASRSPSLRSDSYFTTKELPNLNPPNVTGARVILVHYLGQQPKENCSSPSVKNLTRLLTSKNIPSECVEQPSDVRMLQCADFSNPAACRDIFDTSGSTKQIVTTNIVVVVVSVIVWFV